MLWLRRLLVACALVAWGCGGRGGLPPNRPPMIKGKDGRQYYLLDKGPYKAYYDPWGRLSRIEYDSNGDGKPDIIAHHDGKKSPALIEVDLDFDGRIDRWEYYDETGHLIKVGGARKSSVPDIWTYFNAAGEPIRREYDDDGDGKPERAEILKNGVIVRVEVDADRDGRPDRWQEWYAGRMVSEDLDTDGDGRPDRRIHYGEKGQVLRLEKLEP